MKIDYVLHSINDNKLYSDFWLPVSKIWKLKFNIEPILLVSEKKENFDILNYSQEYGTVINLDLIENIPTHLQALWSRYWYTINFPENVCMISDIDMFPISKNYFIKQLESIDNDKYVHLYSNHLPYLPTCYHVAKGKAFKKILKLDNTFNESMKTLLDSNKNGCINHMGMELWGLDEIYCSNAISSYEKKDEICFLHRNGNRIDRADWKYDINLLTQDFYIDCHSLRPYDKYKKEITDLLNNIMK